MTPSVSAVSASYLREMLRRRAAIVMDAEKDYLIESRLGPVAKTAGCKSIDELLATVRADEKSALGSKVIEAMTTNETYFFRDAHPFEMLQTSILPDLIRARASKRSLRIWCGASSTGQEPYSIAMIIREHFPALASWNVEIVATDINEQVLTRARAGVYTQLEVNRGLPVTMLMKYFERAGAGWKVKPVVRDLVTFRAVNLLDAWPFARGLDVVFMRNVLIYFDVEVKREILRRVHQLLEPDGSLVLGGAETTLNIHPGFEPVRTASAVQYRVKEAA